MNAADFISSLVSGAVAGFSVDVVLFPLDTIKTRLQSAEGFAKAGGFRGVYSGIGPVVIGSMPTAAIFFCTYEFSKAIIGDTAYSHALSASLGEVAACSVRVPVEIVKQRAQASRLASKHLFMDTLRAEGPRGFYRGFWSTVFREIPFSFIQFPIWEAMKKYVSDSGEATPAQSAYCGALSGAIAAGITTPFDVAKTRIMLASRDSKLANGSIIYAMREVYRTKGIIGLFAGITPRMFWMSIGGYIFLGTYDLVKEAFHRSELSNL